MIAPSLGRSRDYLMRRLTPTMWQTALLFGVDTVTNATDYVFHLYLGWALTPGDFAAVQTVNSVLLIVITAAGVMQPVVARYVAAAAVQTRPPVAAAATAAVAPSLPPPHPGPGGASPAARAVFQAFFWQSLAVGVLLTLLAWWGRPLLARGLNVPPPLVAAAVVMLLLALLRPVVAGMLQGQQRFVAFGVTRTVYALGRLGVALLLVSALSQGAAGGVAAMPLGALLALGVGLWLLGRSAWRPAPPLARDRLWAGWRLSLAALVAYTAYMGLLNVDLILVNRSFGPALAGSYATSVVLRRVLAVLPGAVLVILYPRAVASVARGQPPDRLLAKAAAMILAADLLLTAAYFVAGPWLVGLMFGPGYDAAGPLLGWMGLGMLGYGLAAIWMNLFLATRPWPYVAVLGGLLLAQVGLMMALAPASLLQVTALFGGAGWLAAGAGWLLYRLWLRPALSATAADPA